MNYKLKEKNGVLLFQPRVEPKEVYKLLEDINLEEIEWFMNHSESYMKRFKEYAEDHCVRHTLSNAFKYLILRKY